MSLRDYARKRKFGVTPEPPHTFSAAGKTNDTKPIFVVQLHHASHRHYDFRLEVDGALKSWAVPKGPSLRPGERRLAVEVEDHPLSYATFEGDIPKGNYGAGHVRIFDRGTWSTKDEPLEAIAAGKLDFVLHGEKLHGGWKLVRTGKQASKPQWLLFKRNDEYATDAEADDLATDRLDTQGQRKAERGAREGTPHSERAGHSTIVRIDSKKRRTSTGLDEKKWRKRASDIPGSRQKPFPVPFSPQLCSSRTAAPRGDDWLHEVKWDGYRLLAELDAGKVTLRTRSGLDWTGKFPAIAQAIKALPVTSVRLDGELVALDEKGRSDFSRLQHSLKMQDTDGLRYLVFDMPGMAGVDLDQAELIERKRLLEELLANVASPLAFSKHIVGHGEKVFEASKRQGIEGVVSKRVDAPYVQTRSTTWIKVKHEETDEFVVVGYTRPKGSRNGFGSLLMAKFENGRLRYAGRVGTGFDDSTLRAIFKQLSALSQREANVAIPAHATVSAKDVHWVKPGLIAEVAFRGWGKEGLLRQAAFKRMREDKSLVDLQPEQTMDVKITHPDRLVYKSAKISKGDVVDYYRAVAPWMLAELANRPMSLLRCPDGADGTCFFQKHYLDSLGGGVKAIRLRQKDGNEDYIYVDDTAGLVQLVQMNTLEFHPWGSRIDRPEQPDRMIFDLDPAEGVPWKDVIAAARDVRARLRETGLESFVRLTGGKGLHVVAPFERGPSWEDLKHFCEAFANAMTAHRPQAYVATMSKEKRTNKIFIDWLRNTRGATSVTSWSLRARPGAPVAVPLHWEYLGRVRSSSAFDINKAAQRAAKLRADPWAGIYEIRQTMPDHKG